MNESAKVEAEKPLILVFYVEIGDMDGNEVHKFIDPTAEDPRTSVVG